MTSLPYPTVTTLFPEVWNYAIFWIKRNVQDLPVFLAFNVLSSLRKVQRDTVEDWRWKLLFVAADVYEKPCTSIGAQTLDGTWGEQGKKAAIDKENTD